MKALGFLLGATVKKVAVVVVLCLAVYGLYSYAFPSTTLRYRLTLEVEADGRIHSGSGVIQVTYGKCLGWMSNTGSCGYADVVGEAIPVDVPPNGPLFALLSSGDTPRSGPEWTPRVAFGFPMSDSMEETVARVRSIKGSAKVPADQIPPLVRFRNSADPNTAEFVDPQGFGGRFGVTIKSASLEVTKAPVTTGIEKRIPWLADETAIRAFWKALLASGFRAQGSIEPRNLLKRNE